MATLPHAGPSEQVDAACVARCSGQGRYLVREDLHFFTPSPEVRQLHHARLNSHRFDFSVSVIRSTAAVMYLSASIAGCNITRSYAKKIGSSSSFAQRHFRRHCFRRCQPYAVMVSNTSLSPCLPTRVVRSFDDKADILVCIRAAARIHRFRYCLLALCLLTRIHVVELSYAGKVVSTRTRDHGAYSFLGLR